MYIKEKRKPPKYEEELKLEKYCQHSLSESIPQILVHHKSAKTGMRILFHAWSIETQTQKRIIYHDMKKKEQSEFLEINRGLSFAFR